MLSVAHFEEGPSPSGRAGLSNGRLFRALTTHGSYVSNQFSCALGCVAASETRCSGRFVCVMCVKISKSQLDVGLASPPHLDIGHGIRPAQVMHEHVVNRRIRHS